MPVFYNMHGRLTAHEAFAFSNIIEKRLTIFSVE